MDLTIVSHNVTRGDGQGRVNFELAQYAVRNGVSVRILSDTIDESLVADGASWVPIQPGLRRANLLKVWQFARMADHELAARPNSHGIVHANGYVMSMPHSVNTSHFVHTQWLKSPVHVARSNHSLWGAYQALYTQQNARWERHAYRHARMTVAVSQRVKEELVKSGVSADSIRVILNGVDVDEFHPARQDRGSLGLPAGVTLGLFVGDIRTTRKNLDTILQALTSVPNVHLAVAGTTASSPFPALAAQLGVADRVHFLGFRRDIPELMRSADMFVFPSRYEACSLVLLEAIASGLPVITARTAGGAEVITDDCGVVLDDPNDAAALSRALTEMHSNPELRRRRAEAARAVAERCTWNVMATRYLELYEEVAA